MYTEFITILILGCLTLVAFIRLIIITITSENFKLLGKWILITTIMLVFSCCLSELIVFNKQMNIILPFIR